MSTATEVRTVSATGGEKGKKPQQISTIDPQALLMLAEVSAFGAEKYDAFNYLKGYDWNLTYDAAQRHLMQFWNGEDRDEESGLLHVLHAAWHCLAMASFIERELGTDTRFKSKSDTLVEQLRTMFNDEPVRTVVSHPYLPKTSTWLDDYDDAANPFGFRHRFIAGFDPAAPVEEPVTIGFEAGDVVRIVSAKAAHSYVGLECVVKQSTEDYSNHTYLTPSHAPRPDGTFDSFYWNTSRLEKVAAPVEEEPVLGFVVGDQVYVNYGYGWNGFATVVSLANGTVFDGRCVTVEYEGGRTGGFTPSELIKVEDFSIVGAYVADDEGLDALPRNSVLRIEGRAPSVKTRNGWTWASSIKGHDEAEALIRNAVNARGAIVVFDGNVDGPY